MKMTRREFKEFLDSLHLKVGDCFVHPKFAILRDNNDCAYIAWDNSIGPEYNGSSPDRYKFNDKSQYPAFHAFECYYWHRAESTDWCEEAMKNIVALLKYRKKPIYYDYCQEQKIGLFERQDAAKKTRRVISNRNLLKIDGLNLKGNVDGLHGKLCTCLGTKQHFWDDDHPMVLVGTHFLVSGKVSPRLHGDISGVIGEINEGLYGDITGITGYVTNLYGDCTGITLRIKEPLTEKTHIKSLLENRLNGKITLLSNEESLKQWNCYRKIAHCTLGLSDAERELIDKPIKVNPPFPVDKWGRYFTHDKDGDLWCYSINPADIAFLKEIGPLNSCFSFNTYSEHGRWDLGMRCLMALACINPNLGCVFKISSNSTRKMNMFDKISFKWFKPVSGGYYQYTSDGRARLWFGAKDAAGLFKEEYLTEKDVIPIYGHDGISLPQRPKQSTMAYLEEFITSGQTWSSEKTSPNRIVNNNWDVCFDKDWKECSRSGLVPEDALESFTNEAKRVKEIVDGIEI